MPAKILAVDDSRTVRVILRNAFKRFDCEIIEAGDGAEGLKKLAEKPDLVLLDVTMPVMDGITMLQNLRANPATAEIPVFMLTAEGQKATADQALAMGCRGYITKPFTNDVLIRYVRTVLPLQEKPTAVAAV